MSNQRKSAVLPIARGTHLFLSVQNEFIGHSYSSKCRSVATVLTFLWTSIYLPLAFAQFKEEALAQHFLIPNLMDDAPACGFSLPLGKYDCSQEICRVSPPSGASLKSVEISFSCVALGSLTFERPPPDAKLSTVRARNTLAHLMSVESARSSIEEPWRELTFCFYGKENILCGYARTLLLKDKKKYDALPQVKKLISEIELDKPFDPNR